MRTPLFLPLVASLALAQPRPDIEVLHVRGNVYMFASCLLYTSPSPRD